MTIVIRQANEEDEDSVVFLAHEFYSSLDSSFPAQDQDLRNLFRTAVSGGTCFYASKHGEPAGFVVGLMFPAIVNKSVLVGSELAWWVRPKYRNTSAGIKLLKSLEKAFERKGAKEFYMMCLESHDPEMVAGIYQRMGFQPTERTFRKAL